MRGIQYHCVVVIGAGMLLFNSLSVPNAVGQARTETNCNFGMVKGQKRASCHVPVPSSCTVATRPGFDQHWADVSKGGNTSCRFDEEQSDWKTTIVGTCDQCTTDKCSARFSVMFNCTSTTTPPNMQREAH